MLSVFSFLECLCLCKCVCGREFDPSLTSRGSELCCVCVVGMLHERDPAPLFEGVRFRSYSKSYNVCDRVNA